jgi:glycogen synthase
VNVLHLTTEFPPIIYGGLGTAIGGLAEGSVHAGIGVSVLLFGPWAGPAYGRTVPLQGPAERIKGRNAGGTKLFEVSFFQDLEALASVALAARPDVLHLHSFWLWPFAQALRERLQIPLVYTVHSLDRAEYELGHGPPECVVQWVQQETVIRGADRVIALTRSERQLISEYCPGVSDRIRVIGNGMDERPLPCRHVRATPTVLFSGRFVERKGIGDLMDAISIVHASSPAVRFVLAGGHRHSSAEEMEAWLLPPQLHHARDRIHFTGWLTPEQMSQHYDQADILVVPSWYEPFGMVVLEGMMHGLAVAASRVGGPAEILEHGKTGYLFAPRDPAALAASVLRLASDAELRANIAARGANEVRERWLWRHAVRAMRGVYEELASTS